MHKNSNVRKNEKKIKGRKNNNNKRQLKVKEEKRAAWKGEKRKPKDREYSTI